MTNREQTQAALLDQFRQEWTDTPPAELDSGIVAMAVLLEDQLSPPMPSARFAQNLGRRRDAESSHANNHRQVGVLPLLPGQIIPASTPPDSPPTDSHDEPRRSWIFEASRIAAAGLAIALVGMILVLLFRDADDAIAPGAGETVTHPGEILVSWDPNGGEDYKLFIVDTNDGERHKLTPGPAEADGVAERSPAWSPDGRHVAFIQISGNDVNAYKRDLHVVDANGSNLRNLSEMVGITQVPDFSWSPDGTQITFSGSVSGPDELYVVNADGSNLRQLTDGGIGILGASWSPDGSQIAFVSQAENRYGSIYLINADGTGDRRRLTDQVGTFELHWSPDGSQLAFMAGDPVVMSVYVVNRDGSGLRKFTDASTVMSVRPRWSPDEGSIAFVAFDEGGSVGGTYVADSDGSEWRPLTPISGAHEWSPDGEQLAILTSGIDSSGTPTFKSTLYVLDADGSNLRPLIDDASLIQSPAWRPPVTGEEPPPGPDANPTPIPEDESEAPLHRLYVVTSNSVTVTDPATNDEIYSIEAINPDAALSPDGSRLYVLGAGDIFQLTAFDTADGTELWNAPVEDRIRWIGDHGPSTLAVSPDGNQIYLATSNEPDVQQIEILDANTGERIDETETIIGYCPAMLHPSGDGNNLFLVCQRSGQVHVLNLHTLEFDGGSKCCGPNVGSIMSSDGTFLYIIQTNGTGGYGVTIVTSSDRSTDGTHQLAEGEQPPLLGQMVTLSPDGTRLYIAIGTDDNDRDAVSRDVREIAVFDTSGWEEADRIILDVPLKGGAFTMSPDGQSIYASEQLQRDSDGKLIRIDVESGETNTVLVRNAEILRVLTAPAQPVETAPPPIPTAGRVWSAPPPPARLSYGDQTQVQRPRTFCWTTWDGSSVCEEADGPPPPAPALVVPPGAELIFTVDEVEDF